MIWVKFIHVAIRAKWCDRHQTLVALKGSSPDHSDLEDLNI